MSEQDEENEDEHWEILSLMLLLIPRLLPRRDHQLVCLEDQDYFRAFVSNPMLELSPAAVGGEAADDVLVLHNLSRGSYGRMWEAGVASGRGGLFYPYTLLAPVGSWLMLRHYLY